MRLFDPDDFISPIVVRARILIQRLWLRIMDWDDVIEDSAGEGTVQIVRVWFASRQEFAEVQTIRIPRWSQAEPNPSMQNHRFSEVSQVVYSVAICICAEKLDDTVAAKLATTQTRAAPLTRATAPKLEFSAAHLMVRPLPSITEEYSVIIEICYSHTDTMIALQWLRKSPAKLGTLRANGAAEIQELTEGAHLSRVVTEGNPSDLCSRGKSPSESAISSLWWLNPSRHNQPADHWPMSNLTIGRNNANIISAALEMPKPVVTAGFVDINAPNIRTVVTNGALNEVGLHRTIGDWRRLLRVTAYVVRFISNCRKKKGGRKRFGQNTDQEVVCV